MHYLSTRYFFVLLTSIVLFARALSTSMPKRVAIVGSTGQLGRRALNQLLDRKIPVKCLIRQSTPPDFLLETQKQYPDLLEFVTDGDVTNAPKVKELLTDCSHCLALHGATAKSSWFEVLTAAESSEDSDPTHSKQINYESMKTFVECAKETGCQHIVRITGKGEQPWSFFSVLINGLGRMAKGWNNEGEAVLRERNDVDYTIIRPGIMKADFDPKESNVHMKLADNGGDLKVSVVGYDQIAELCVESLLQPQAKRTTLTAMNVEGPGPSIAESLQQVKTDTRNFPRLIDEHKKAVKVVFRSLAAAFLAVVAGVILKILG